MIMAVVVSDANEGHGFLSRCLKTLLTNTGWRPAGLPGSLPESKNLGSNDALSTRPFCVMYKRVPATLAPRSLGGQAASSDPFRPKQKPQSRLRQVL